MNKIEEALEKRILTIPEENKEEWLSTWRRLIPLLKNRGDSDQKIINEILA